MGATVTHTSRASFPVLKDLARHGVFTEQILMEMGRIASATMAKRIRADRLTSRGEPLDPNSPAWAEFKVEEGLINQPLAAEGRMTSPRAWKPEVKRGAGGYTLTLKLSPEHQEKWDNIIRIAEERGKNWNEAWGIGEMEAEAMMRYARRALNRRMKRG